MIKIKTKEKARRGRISASFFSSMKQKKMKNKTRNKKQHSERAKQERNVATAQSSERKSDRNGVGFLEPRGVGRHQKKKRNRFVTKKKERRQVRGK